MLYSCIYYTTVTVVGLLALAFLKLLYKYVMTMRKLEFYKDQGIFILPGADRFIFGNLFDTLAYKTAID